MEVAATLKQDGYSPLIRALDFFIKQGRVIYVFGDSWVIAPSSHMCPAAVLGGTTKTLAPSSGGHSPCNAYNFLHRVRFGGLAE